MEFRAIQKILLVVLVVIFCISTGFALIAGYGIFTSVFWSFMNIIGADFPPASSLVDPHNLLLFVADGLDIQGKLIITIILTTIFYQLLGRFDLKGRVMQKKLRSMSGHVILTPADGIAVEMARKLQKFGKGYVIVEQNPHMVKKLLNEGFLVINADPAQQDSLETAGVRRASYLLLLDEDDVRNTLIAIEAKRINENLEIVARIKRQEDIARMKRAGISRLVLPEISIGDKIGEFVTETSSKSI
ncbi:MAG: NAD-binding protein [Candidatus Micrarchaeota archaeon]|nr:NAD-binding protein [Candidatus Micrarchaeota archaeon]MDE1847762.1 NAD-binding protein [Candidatus Micrarchaeota archaeon]MDE1863905.1 NAD-binding protein [Candidatus Micrarchaeota archaeon]